MTSSINASLSAGVVTTADTSGILQLQTASTAALTITAAQNVLVGTTTQPSESQARQTLATSSSTYLQFARTATTIGGSIIGTSGQNFIVQTYTGAIGSETYTERMRISSAGVVTAPYQPCFLAYRTTTQSGTSPFTVLFDTVPVNVGSCYDSGTGRFTAPVTGNYHFTFQTLGIVGSWSSFDVFSYKNGGSTPSILSTRPNSTSGSDNASALSTSVGICNLTAGDYIEIKALNTTSIYSDGNAWLKFMGFLIG